MAADLKLSADVHVLCVGLRSTRVPSGFLPHFGVFVSPLGVAAPAVNLPYWYAYPGSRN